VVAEQLDQTSLTTQRNAAKEMEIVAENKNLSGPATGVPGKGKPLISEVPGERHQWTFEPLQKNEEGLLGDRENQETLLRWGLDQTLILEKFRVTSGGKDLEGNPEAVLLDFFNSSQVQAHLQQVCSTPERSALKYPHGVYHKVGNKALRTSQTDLSLFHRLKSSEHRLATEQGYLRKCMDEIYDGATSTTLVGDMLLNEESEHYDTYSEEEKEELLFCLFRWLMVGGTLNQADENLQPYMNMLKRLYKELVCVVKDLDTQQIRVTSRPFLVSSLDQSASDLFTVPENSHNVCIVVFHPQQYTVTYFCSSFIPYL